MNYEVLRDGKVITASDSATVAMIAFQNHMKAMFESADASEKQNIELRLHPEKKFVHVEFTHGDLK